MKALIVGLGYVGLPLALRAAEVGHDVIGVDSALWKIQELEGGRSYIDDIPHERVAQATRFTPRLAMRGLRDTHEWDIAIIAVPTPLFEDTIDPDLTYVEDAARFIGAWMAPGRTVVLESTTYPGTTEEVVGRIIEEKSGLRAGVDFHLGFSPERIDPGNKVHTFENTPKVVSGVDAASLERIQNFYDTLVDKTVAVSSPRAAEMTKLIENVYAYTNIALVNEIALLCRELELDVDEILDAAATKGFSFTRWRPGPGPGGHCLPADSTYLTHHMRHRHHTPFRFAELAHEVNRGMPAHVVSRAEKILGGSIEGKKILLLGIAYKPNVRDTRDSASLTVAKLLVRHGALLTISDPHVATPATEHHEVINDAQAAVAVASEFDLCIITTDHDIFDYDELYENARAILDTRNRMGPRNGKVHKL